jgi:branched-chain amino acid transport system substrate-binding protein
VPKSFLIRAPLRGLVMLAVGLLVLSACGRGLGGNEGAGNGGGTGGGEQTLTIGYVTPQTGPLAAFGEADKFVVDQMNTLFKDHPIQAGGKTYKVDIVVKDTQSDSRRAGEVTSALINGGADLILAASTPDTVNPVADQCEANGVPCITTVAPWQTFYYGRGAAEGKPFKWTYHFFWGLEDAEKVYQDLWGQVSTNKQVGALWPNNTDGNAWSGDFPKAVTTNGYTLTSPGFYPDGTQDFSSQISAFRNANTQLLVAVPTPPEFATFWQQAQQQGYHPVIATVAKALLFPSAVEAIGPSANNLCTEVWWSPQHPFTSSLTGQTAKQLADAYEQTTGRQWTQPIGFVHALFEVAAAAVTKAGGTDHQAVANAISTLKVSTVVGNLDWTSGPVPNAAKTPLVGGQWRATPGGPHKFDLVIVSNSLAPRIPTGGRVQPLVSTS